MIGEVCTKPVVTVSTKASIQEAARLMRQKRVGAIVVLDGVKPSGILTDRDIAVSVVADGRDPATVRVGEVMHRSPAVIREDEGIFDAVKLFSGKGVRRLPVVDGKGKLIGIIALDDLLMLFGREMGHVASALARGLGRPAAA
jgi:CBS domain-containing protein